MNKWKAVVLLLIAVAVIAALYGAAVIRRGFSALDQPSRLEIAAARAIRGLGIPGSARNEKNPWTPTPEALQQAREDFTNHCAGCHGKDGDGQTGIARNLYPKPPDLRLPETQNLTDGEIHYIIANGVRLTGMPALGNPHMSEDDNTAWKLVLFIRSISGTTPQEKAEQTAAITAAQYVGSAACQKCHAADLRELEENTHGQRGARSSRASRRHYSRSRHEQCQQEIHQGRCCICLRQHLEAALFHQSRR